MNTGERNQVADVPPLHEVYIVELREHALALVWLGYQRMRVTDFLIADEDEITGELARHMDAVTQAEDTPPWAEHYTVKEQVRSHTAGRFGKRRPIVDVEFERHKRGRRPRLRFEAKRLGRGAGIGDYLGSEGLGAFLEGYYSLTHNEAGMLGYIQEGTEQAWAEKLSVKLVPPSCKVITGGGWTLLQIPGSSPHTYQTIHLDRDGARLLVLHILLGFAH